MKKVCYLFFLFSFVSCYQNDLEFKLQNSFSVEGDSNYISEKDCFYFCTDSNLFSLTMYYSYGKYGDKQMIDTMDYTDMQYGSTLNSFKSEKNNSYVVLWKIKHEFSPIFKVYYVRDGKLIKMGVLTIYTPCETCDYLDYSIEDMQIFQKNNEIKISFLKNIYYWDTEKNEGTLYDAETLILSFNIE